MVRQYLLEKYKGKTVTIRFDSRRSLFTAGGLKATLKRRNEHRLSFGNLDALVENSYPVGYENVDKRHKSVNPYLKGQYIYVALLNIDNGSGQERYVATIKLDDFGGGNPALFKDISIQKMPSLYAGGSASAGEPDLPEYGNDINVRQLIEIARRKYDGNPLFIDKERALALPSKGEVQSSLRTLNVNKGSKIMTPDRMYSKIGSYNDKYNNSSVIVNQKYVDEISSAVSMLGMKVPVKVIGSEEELPFEVRESVWSDRIAGRIKGDWLGLFRDGVAYINASAHDSVEEAVVTALHEGGVHYGLRAWIPDADERSEFLRKCYNSFYQVRVSADAKRDNGMDFEEAVEETIADFADDEHTKTVWAKIVDWIKDILAKLWNRLGIGELPDDTQLREIINDAMTAARASSAENISQASDVQLMRTVSQEIERRYPGWASGTVTSKGGHSTQIAGTVKTYANIGRHLMHEGFNGKILDASSGLGHGTETLREMGFDVTDVEPYPVEGYSPAYTRYSDVPGRYDLVISNAVLNVIPDDWRDSVLKNMIDKVAPGGRMIVNVRGRSEVAATKQKVELESPSEILVVDRKGRPYAYQRGFDVAELTEYVQSMAGSDFTVEKATEENSGVKSGVAVVARRAGQAPASAATFGKIYYRKGRSAQRASNLVMLNDWLKDKTEAALDWSKRMLMWGERRGGARPFINRMLIATKGNLAADREKVTFIVKQMNDAADKFKKEKWSDAVHEQMGEVLRGARELKDVDHFDDDRVKDFGAAVLQAREHQDALSLRIVAEMGDLLPFEIACAIENNRGKYILRAYRKFSDKEYKPAETVRKNAASAIRTGLLDRIQLTQNAINQANYTQQAKRTAMLSYLVSRDDIWLQGQSEAFQRRARVFVKLIDRVQSVCNNAIVSRVENGMLQLQAEPKTLEATVQGTIDYLLQKDTAAGGDTTGDKSAARWKIIRKSFIRRKDLPVWLRELYGEIYDPAVSFQMSAGRAVRVLAMDQLYRSLLEFNKAQAVTSKDRVFYEAPYEDKNGSYVIQLKGKGFGVLEGWYTDKATFETLTEHTGEGMIPGWYKRIVGAVQAAHTVMNIPTHARNFMSNIIFATLDGEAIRNPDNYGKAYMRAARVLIQNSEAASKERRRLMRLGLITSGAHGEEFHRSLEAAYGKQFSFMDFPTLNWFGKTMQGLEAAYAFEDNVYKVAAFYAREMRGMTAEDAVREVSRCYPFYDMAPSYVNVTRQYNPLAPDFMSFALEADRVFVNAVIDAFKAAKNGDWAKVTGVLAALLLAVGAGSLSLGGLIGKIFGDDDQDKERRLSRKELRALRELLPVYRRNNVVYPYKEKGEIRYVDMGYIYPFEDMSAIVAMGDKMVSGQAGEWKPYKELGAHVLGNYMIGGMVPETVAQLMTNRDAYGKQIFSSRDSALEDVEKFLKTALKLFMPSMVVYGYRAWSMIYQGEDQLVTADGEVVTVKDNLSRTIEPLRVYELNPSMAYSRRMRSLSMEVRDEKAAANSAVRRFRSGQMSRQDAAKIVEIVRQHFNDSALMREIYRVDQAGIDLGLSVAQRQALLHESGFTLAEVEAILKRNKFIYNLPEK